MVYFVALYCRNVELAEQSSQPASWGVSQPTSQIAGQYQLRAVPALVAVLLWKMESGGQEIVFNSVVQFFDLV